MATRIRRPEYTGENRCVLCTVLNAIIAIGIGGLLAVVDPRLGALSLVVSAVMIYARGYLVPGTPTITKTYGPKTLLLLSSVERSPTAVETTNSSSAHMLSVAGVVADSQEGDARLTTDFRTEWRERMRTIRKREVGQAYVLELFDAETVSAYGRLSFVIDNTKLHQWESEAALIADVAAAFELRSRSTKWSDADASKRTKILTGVRLLVQRCPACDGPVSTTTDHVSHCCRKSQTGVASVCQECGETIVATSVPSQRPLDTEALFHRLIAEQ